jgi:hypothetical protein
MLKSDRRIHIPKKYVSVSVYRGDIFRPQTRRFGEITVLYTQLITKKFGIHWVRSVWEQVLYYRLNTVFCRLEQFNAAYAIYPQFLIGKLCVQHGVISPTRRVWDLKISLQNFSANKMSIFIVSHLTVYFPLVISHGRKIYTHNLCILSFHQSFHNATNIWKIKKKCNCKHFAEWLVSVYLLDILAHVEFFPVSHIQYTGIQ